jgi:hypothetical protein
MATKTDTLSPALRAADGHELIRVHGARVNNLKDISVEIPKRRLTVFTGVSGSGKSSLVFATIAAESQRLINETYSAFVQGFTPTLARPEVDVLEGLTTAIVVDQERMGAGSTGSWTPASRSSSSPTTRRSWRTPTGSSTSAPAPATTAGRSSFRARPPSSSPRAPPSPVSTSRLTQAPDRSLRGPAGSLVRIKRAPLSRPAPSRSCATSPDANRHAWIERRARWSSARTSPDAPLGTESS